MSNDFKNQHIVPQSYLKRFAVNKNGKFIIGTRLTPKNKREVKLFTSSVSDVAYIENYYDTYRQTDKKHWEHFLDKNFDVLCGKPLDNIVSKITLSTNNINVISQDDKKILSKIIVSQAIRVPIYLDEQIEKSKSIIQKYHEQTIASLPDNFEKYKKVIQNLSFDVETRKNMILEGLFEESRFNRFCEALEQRIWIIFYNSIRRTMPFITSDNPVLFSDIKGNQGKINELGIASDETVILYPLTPSIMIGIYSPKIYFGLINSFDCCREMVSEMKFITKVNMELMAQSQIHSFLPEPLFSEVQDKSRI